MVKKKLNKIFLSASIPYEERDAKYFDTADVIAIRDAVRALATVVIPKAQLIWGGHPAITPLIRFVVNKMRANLKKHVTLYQSAFFKEYFPKDNFDFENIVITERLNDRDSSLDLMRSEMISNNDYVAGIFIGGMEGVIDEYELFKRSHPQALILPIASTGAAAKIIYEEHERLNKRLVQNYAFMNLFQEELSEYLT